MADKYEYIEGSAGKLQLLVDKPQSPPCAIAVICHPHTLYGGTLSNKVVHQLSRTFVELGAVVVRFNFRGAGNSEGVYDAGTGEVEDLLSVTGWAKQVWKIERLWLAGFSFGAYVALRASKQLAPDWLVTVAPPVNLFEFTDPVATGSNWLLIHGEKDETVPLEAVTEWLGSLDRAPLKVVIPDAGHFFHRCLNQLQTELVRQVPAC